MFLSGLIRYDDEPIMLDASHPAIEYGELVRETLFTKREDYSDQYEFRFVLSPTLEMIAEGYELPLNEDGFYLARIEPIECQPIYIDL